MAGPGYTTASPGRSWAASTPAAACRPPPAPLPGARNASWAGVASATSRASAAARHIHPSGASPAPASSAVAGRQNATYRKLYTGVICDTVTSASGGTTSHGSASQVSSRAAGPGALTLRPQVKAHSGSRVPVRAGCPAGPGESRRRAPRTASAAISTTEVADPAASQQARYLRSGQPGCLIQPICPRCRQPQNTTGAAAAAVAMAVTSHRPASRRPGTPPAPPRPARRRPARPRPGRLCCPLSAASVTACAATSTRASSSR